MGVEYEAVVVYGMEVAPPDFVEQWEIQHELEEYWAKTLETNGVCPVTAAMINAGSEEHETLFLALKEHAFEIDVKYGADKWYEIPHVDRDLTDARLRAAAEALKLNVLSPPRMVFGIYVH